MVIAQDAEISGNNFRGGRGRGGRGRDNHWEEKGAAGQPRTEIAAQLRQNLNNWQLSHVINNISDVAKDQEGSRFIQRKLDENATQEEIQILN